MQCSGGGLSETTTFDRIWSMSEGDHSVRDGGSGGQDGSVEWHSVTDQGWILESC